MNGKGPAGPDRSETHSGGGASPTIRVSQSEARRTLGFLSVTDIMPEVRRLVPAHRTIAHWSLGQICKHLADSFTGSIKGFDLRNHRIKRFFFKRQILREVLTKGIRSNYTVDPNITPPPGIDVQDGVTELEEAITTYLNHSGKLQAHPLFGKMPRATWDRVHCVHCAHHLSFVIPVP